MPESRTLINGLACVIGCWHQHQFESQVWMYEGTMIIVTITVLIIIIVVLTPVG